MKIKVAVLINSLNGGGAERTAAKLLNELNNDFEIHLVLISNIIEYRIPEDQKIFCFNVKNDENGIIKFLKLPLLAYRYKNYCKINNIEKSLSFLTKAHYINCLSKLFGSHSKVIISEQVHVSTYLSSFGKFGKSAVTFLIKKLYSKADMIITNAELIKKDLKENFKINTAYKVINNPIDFADIQRLKNESLDTPSLFETFTFINAGSFRPQKNHDLLINAFNKIKDINCSLLLLGKGGKNEINTRQKVKDLNLESKVFFLGFDNNPFKYLAKANCFVLSSDYEGFPNVVQEALACNLPVISTDCLSGPREILAPDSDIYKIVKNDIEIAKYGILVPIQNAELLAKAMRLIYSDSSLSKGFQANVSARAKDFDVAKIMNQYREILSDGSLINQ